MNEELEALKRKADTLGVTYSPNIGAETLRARINEKLSPETVAPVADTAPVTDGEAIVKTQAQVNRELRKEATRMIRCRITCMNPAKQDVPGEIIAICNNAIGVVKHFVPFGEVTDNGWHIPKIIYDELVTRKCTVMRPKRDGKGLNSHEPVHIREFAIEVMEPLTEQELKELAQRQAMAAGSSAALEA